MAEGEEDLVFKNNNNEEINKKGILPSFIGTNSVFVITTAKTLQ